MFYNIDIRGLFKKWGPQVFVFFFRQHWNKLPRGECSGGLYDQTVKIWRLCVFFSSCFSIVKVKLPVAGAAKFEIRVVMFFTGWRLAGWPWKSFFSLFFLEIHFWGVPEDKNTVHPNSYWNGKVTSHFEFSVTSLMEFQVIFQSFSPWNSLLRCPRG